MTAHGAPKGHRAPVDGVVWAQLYAGSAVCGLGGRQSQQQIVADLDGSRELGVEVAQSSDLGFQFVDTSAQSTDVGDESHVRGVADVTEQRLRH